MTWWETHDPYTGERIPGREVDVYVDGQWRDVTEYLREQ